MGIQGSLCFGAVNSPCLCLPVWTQLLCPCSPAEESARQCTGSSVAALILASAQACLPGSHAISNCVFTALSSAAVSVRYLRGDLACCAHLTSHSLWHKSCTENGGQEEAKLLVGGQRLSAMPNMEINRSSFTQRALHSCSVLCGQLLIILCLASIH